MKKLTPREAKTWKQILSLKRDNISTPGYWFLLDVGEVHLAAQKNKENATAAISIPRRDFNKFVDFYNGTKRHKRG